MYESVFFSLHHQLICSIHTDAHCYSFGHRILTFTGAFTMPGRGNELMKGMRFLNEFLKLCVDNFQISLHVEISNILCVTNRVFEDRQTFSLVQKS